MPPICWPLGTGCDKGKGGGVWVTEDLPFEQAEVLSTNQVKFAHQDLTASPSPAQLKAEKLSRPSLRV